MTQYALVQPGIGPGRDDQRSANNRAQCPRARKGITDRYDKQSESDECTTEDREDICVKRIRRKRPSFEEVVVVERVSIGVRADRRAYYGKRCSSQNFPEASIRCVEGCCRVDLNSNKVPQERHKNDDKGGSKKAQVELMRDQQNNRPRRECQDFCV